jgi:hypothetical protein
MAMMIDSSFIRIPGPNKSEPSSFASFRPSATS